MTVERALELVENRLKLCSKGIEELKQIQIGDVIVFVSHRERQRSDPIIHRVTDIDVTLAKMTKCNYL